MQTTDPDVRDLRSSPRFLVRTSLAGSFGPVDVEICDMSDCGIQVRHNESIRLGTSAKLACSAPEMAERISLRGTVVWSRLSNASAGSGGRYVSGIRLEPHDEGPARSVIEELTRLGLAIPDEESLATKRRRMNERQASRRQAGSTRQVFQSTLPNDQVLMINHARERLRQYPDEARKWYMRAKFAAAEDATRAREAPMHYRDDILAVWEYLERSVDLATVVKVFEKQLR